MSPDLITPLIITYNESDNIERTLARLTWARRIIVVDSGSTDGTLDIVARYEHAHVAHRAFDDFAAQCNFGLSLIETPWALSLDADYELSSELINEIARLEPGATTAGYRARFVYRIYGRPLRATLYPPRVVLYRRETARYRSEGHGHRVMIDGNIRDLDGAIFHDDRKPLARWFASQQSYARREAEHLLTMPREAMSRTDRIRVLAWPAPPLVFIYTLFVKRCLLDGWPGWIYALQRTLAEIVIALEILDRRARAKPPEHSA